MHKPKYYGRAIEDYNEAIRLDPNDKRVYILRGIAYLLCEKPFKAAKSFYLGFKYESKLVQILLIVAVIAVLYLFLNFLYNLR